MSWIDGLLSWGKPTRARTASEEKYLYHTASVSLADRSQDNGEAFPRFQATAGDQLDPKRADRFALIRSRLRNAYTPAQPVTDRRMFAGRTKLMTTLIRSIEDQRLHTVIYGERGIGKTSLLQVLAKSAEEARYLVVYVTCGARSEFDETFRAIAARIPLMFHSGYGPTSREGERGDTLLSLLGPEPVGVRNASDALARIEGTRVLVILDEFDRAESEDFRRSIAELLKTLSDQSVRVQMLIAGVAANLTELIANVPSIQRNVFALRVPKMTPSEVRSIVKNGETISDLHFEEPAIQAIIARCMGFPYLATLLSHRSALVAVDDGRLTVNGDDVGIATEEAVEEFKGRISRRSQLQIDGLVRRGQLAVLGALAGAAQSTGGWFNVEDITSVHAEASSIHDAQATVESLANNHVLIEVGDDGFGQGYRFLEATVPVYLWLLAARGQYFDHQHPALESVAG